MKKVVATVAALAFTISLAACGEAGEKAAEETAEAAETTCRLSRIMWWFPVPGLLPLM